ncbi:MAG: hypothetical protein Q8Q08_02510 [Candidatus Omnitrophota bacterium]|nr:hypothetical protein [Candidatus Omnitrophota bacterium]MDZ4243024.1 hypothetical protein [Candidatus Omnitrophota bacterium]
MSGLGEMVYLRDKAQWRWLPNTTAIHERGTIPDVLKWKRAPEEIANEFGVHAYIPKPFSRDVLVDAIRGVSGAQSLRAQTLIERVGIDE